MKQTIISVLLVLIFTVSHQSSQPQRIESSVKDIVFVSPDIAWVVARNNKIAKTTDGGATWNTVFGPDAGTPSRLAFIDTGRGWGIDDKGHVRATRDGGMSWQHISNVGGEDLSGIGPMIKLVFIDEMNGWALDSFTLWRTQDGGATWREEKSEGWFHFLQFVDKRIGWLCDGGRNAAIYKTVDGGDTWQKKHINGLRGQIATLSFASNQKGWVGTGHGIFHTTDGGKNWIEQPVPGKDVRITSTQFLDENVGWATVVDFEPEGSVRFWFKSMLIHTVDGGNTWQIATRINGDEWYHKVHFRDQRRGWLYTDTALYRTIDGGHTWNAVLEYPRPSYKID